jgi:DNA polymerase III epsilon subunit-like protein
MTTVTPALEPTIVIIDFESTGLNLGKSEIIQASCAVASKNGVKTNFETLDVFSDDGMSIVDAKVDACPLLFSTIVSGDVSIEPGALAVVGITDACRLGHPRFVEAWRSLVKWALSHVSDDSHLVLVAHNGEAFDFPLLFEHLRRHLEPIGFNEGTTQVIDTYRIVKRMIPGERSHRLGSLYQLFMDRPMRCAHDATGDVIALGQIFQVLNRSKPRKEWAKILTSTLGVKRAEWDFQRKYYLKNININVVRDVYMGPDDTIDDLVWKKKKKKKKEVVNKKYVLRNKRRLGRVKYY